MKYTESHHIMILWQKIYYDDTESPGGIEPPSLTSPEENRIPWDSNPAKSVLHH